VSDSDGSLKDTSNRIYDDFIRLLFLHAHRESSTMTNELPENQINFDSFIIAVTYVEQYAEDFEGFLVNEKRVHQLGTLEGERQRTVKEWCTFMGQPTEYGDDILLQAITMHLKKPVQVFSYDSKDDTVYIQVIDCNIRSNPCQTSVSAGDSFHVSIFGVSKRTW
jgi:hypothetical protein